MRVCGVLAALCGAVFLGWVALLTLHPPLLSRFNGVVADPNLAPPLFMAGAWFLILGICILRARTYRPDLGDAAYLIDPFGAKLRRLFPPSRTWWTGDPAIMPGSGARLAESAHAPSSHSEPLGPASRPHESVRLIVQRLTGTLLMGLGIATFAWVTYLQFTFYARMPRAPDPTTGRVAPVFVMRSRVYVTGSEARAVHLAGSAAMAGGFATFCALILLSEARRAQRGRALP
jgi:hypothetical protein